MPETVAETRMPVLLGGRLALDFANTVEGREGKRPHEFVTRYADLVRWILHAGGLNESGQAELLATASGDKQASASAFEQAVALREALYRVFVAIARQQVPDQADLDMVTSCYERTVEYGQLVERDSSFDWIWPEGATALDRPLWPIALDAVDLLRSDQLPRVKQCGNVEGCGWLFLDTSRNGSRRWCSMAVCGSRIKMRRQYAKRRATTSP